MLFGGEKEEEHVKWDTIRKTNFQGVWPLQGDRIKRNNREHQLRFIFPLHNDVCFCLRIGALSYVLSIQASKRQILAHILEQIFFCAHPEPPHPYLRYKLEAGSECQWRANGPCVAPLMSSPLRPFVGIIVLHSPLIPRDNAPIRPQHMARLVWFGLVEIFGKSFAMVNGIKAIWMARLWGCWFIPLIPA